MTVKQLIAQLSELPQDYEINMKVKYSRIPVWSMLDHIEIDHICLEVELHGEE